jgi:hypothetical protein
MKQNSAAAQYQIDVNHPERRKFFGFHQNDFVRYRATLVAEGNTSDAMIYVMPQMVLLFEKYKEQLGETDCDEVYMTTLDKFCQEVLPKRDFAEKDANPYGYCYTMLDNAMLQRLEKKKKQGVIAIDEERIVAIPNGETFNQELEKALQDLEQAMEIMCKPCNEIIDAHYWKNLKPNKIADAVTQGILAWFCFGSPDCGIRKNKSNTEANNKNVTANEVSQRLVRIRKDIFNYMNQGRVSAY